MTPPTASVAVVIIGRNEGKRLARCLASIHEMRPFDGELEMIYVDSNSTDGSPTLAAAAGATVLSVTSAHPTAALGRNAGWRAATADFILFLDGDTILHPGFLQHALESIQSSPDIIAVWGHRREIHPERTLYNRVLDLDWIYAPGVVDYCGGDVLMRRSALQQVDGYDPTLIAGEEPELCRRMRAQGGRILHIDQPMTGHDLDMTRFRQYWKRATRAGHAYAEISSRFRNTPDQFWQPQRRQNLLRGSFWTLSFLAAIATSILFHAILPAATWCALLILMAFRSARAARWKSPEALTLFLYGIHSHLQQVPILFGQLQFDLNQKRGKRRQLVDYKNPA